MILTRFSGAFAAAILFACLVFQIIVPGCLLAQPIPQVYYLNMLGYSQSYSHPGTSFNISYYLSHTPDNPLVVNNIRQVTISHNYADGYTIIDTTYYAFNGSFEQYNGYFVCRSFGGKDYDIVYRTSKISNDGYYLEDDYSLDANNINPLTRVWYEYNNDMKLVKATYKYSYGYWDKIESEVDSLGRRLQDITYSSADSLSWTPSIRCRYTYTGDPSSLDLDFEKYLAYPSAYYIYPRSSMPIYINNDWELESYIFDYMGDDDVWYDEYSLSCNLHETATGYSMYVFSSLYSWDANGLPTAVNQPSAYETPGFSFAYSHTGDVDVDDEHVPPAPKLSIWPNPSKGQSHIRLDIANQTDVSVQTYNLRGQLIKRESYHHTPNIENDYCWNACDAKGNALTNGVYLLKIDWKGGSTISRIVFLK